MGKKWNKIYFHCNSLTIKNLKTQTMHWFASRLKIGDHLTSSHSEKYTENTNMNKRTTILWKKADVWYFCFHLTLLPMLISFHDKQIAI